MAYIQKNTPPPNKILSFSLRNFVGGLNNRSETLKENEASNLINMAFSDDTAMEKRKGITSYDTFLNANAITFMDEFKPYNDVNQLIRATDTEVFIGNLKVATVAGKISGTNYQGKYFFVDGNFMYVYGKFAQATTTYEKVVGTPNAGYVLLKVVNPPAGYTPLASTYNQGVTAYDYTNFQVWYEPCDNEVKDTYKGANVIPTSPKFMVVHNGRIFASGNDKDDDNVFLTHIGKPFYFPVSLPMQLPPNSDKVVGMKVYDNSVVIGRMEDIYVILGNTNRPDIGGQVFMLKRINTHTGFANNDAVTIAHNFLLFLGSDGNAYSLGATRADDKNLATSILTQTIDLMKDPINLTMTDVPTATAFFFKDEWYLSIKGKVLIYSYRHRAWTMYDQLEARSFYKMGNELVWGRADGQTAKFGDDYYDYGIPFQAFWASKYFDMNDTNSYKQFREFFLVAHTFKDLKSDINVTFEIDYVDVKDQYKVSNQISVWGKAKWGDRFINRNIVSSLPFVIGRRGRAIKFTFSNSFTPSAPVATYSGLDAYLGKKEGLLVYVEDESKYYLYTDFAWVLQSDDDLNQPMRIYQVNGDYELRGKR